MRSTNSLRVKTLASLAAALLPFGGTADAQKLPGPLGDLLGMLAKVAPPPSLFSPGELEKVIGCVTGALQKTVRGGDLKRLLQSVTHDAASLLDGTARDVLGALKTELPAMLDESVRESGKKADFGKLLDRAFKRFDRAAAKYGPSRCFRPFVTKAYKHSRPHLVKLAEFMRSQVHEIWTKKIEPKLIELMRKGIVQAVSALAGEEAESVITAAVSKHLLDLKRFRAVAGKLGAFSKALSGGGDVQQAQEQAVEAAQPKEIDKARLMFDILVELVRLKARQWVDRGCPDAGVRGEDEGFNWKEPGMSFNRIVVRTLESKIPGGACLVDLAGKLIEGMIDKVHVVVDTACGKIPFGGAAVCTSIMWGLQFAAKYAVLVVAKAAALDLGKSLVDAAIRFVARKLKQRLSRQLDKGNKLIDQATKKLGPLGGWLAKAVDQIMREFLDEKAGQFIEVIDLYYENTRKLVEAAGALGGRGETAEQPAADKGGGGEEGGGEQGGAPAGE